MKPIFPFYYFLKERAFQILWISLVLYVFYETFIYYKEAPQFFHLRNMLGFGLYISRGTATVLNISCALVLLPLCKKINKALYRPLAQFCPGLFFFWLEKSKSFHMTVAVTLLLFAVIHSVAHFANLWNFSRNYNDNMKDVNFANYKNENPLFLLMTQPGLTGVSMLIITVLMGMTSLRVVRRKCYNAFWYTHHLYFPFMVLLLIHPLSGVLKQEVLIVEGTSQNYNSSQLEYEKVQSTHLITPAFVAIKSKTWLWMAVPLSCFLVDLLWRFFSRNRARVDILEVQHMPGRMLSLLLGCPDGQFRCCMGQYLLLQCLDISLMEWHPFTVVKLPTARDRTFTVWIRVVGDWTEALERLLLEKGPKSLTMLVDGPFSSPMQGVSRSKVAVCVAAGVGVTPFVAVLQHVLKNPRSDLPGRIHFIWIVKQEYELTWLTDLVDKIIIELRNANRPDKVHFEFYVTKTSKETSNEVRANDIVSHIVIVDEKGELNHKIITKLKKDTREEEKVTLLTPMLRRSVKCNEQDTRKYYSYLDKDYDIAKKYPLLGCRMRKGRPHWNRLFGYWTHLYPEEQINLFCCGPKKLGKLLRKKSNTVSHTTNTTITFIHEGFT